MGSVDIVNLTIVGIAIPVAALELELALKIFTGRSRLIRIPPPL